MVRIRDSADYKRHDGFQILIRRPEGPRDPNDDYFIRFNDGRLTYGTSWWVGRHVPPEYAERLPDNGEYISQDEYHRLAAMRGAEGQVLFPVVKDPPLERARSEVREIVHAVPGRVLMADYKVPPDIDCGPGHPRRWSDFLEAAKLFVLERHVDWEGVGFTDKLELLEKHVDFRQVSDRDKRRALGRDWLARKAFDRLLVDSARRAQAREPEMRGPAPTASDHRPNEPGPGDSPRKKRRGR
jgi:hypothetical protein